MKTSTTQPPGCTRRGSRDCLHYILACDAGEARALRRRLAENGTQLGVQVGTWLELLKRVQDHYLVTPTAGWVDALQDVLANNTDAFWHGSWRVDPHGVAGAVEQSWRRVLCARAPEQGWPTGLDVDARIAGRLDDLARLNDIPHAAWPEDLATLRQVLLGPLTPVRSLHIVPTQPLDNLDAWQQAFIQKLNADADALDASLQTLVDDYLADASKPKARPDSNLHILQAQLFARDNVWTSRDGSCELIQVRDALEGLELVAGLIQHAMDTQPGLEYADFGILLPQGYAHSHQLAGEFADWGIPLSNLKLSHHERDLGPELIHFALRMFEGASPSMLIKALVSNPLMPWSRDVANELVNRLDRSPFGLKPPDNIPAAQQALARRLNQSLQVTDVPEALAQLTRLLREDEGLAVHHERALAAAQAVTEAIETGEQSWDNLKGLCNPASLIVGDGREVTQEGVTILYEGETAWRSVQELFVLDFVNGHYPQDVSMPLVFALDEWHALRNAGLPLVLPDEQLGRARQQLRRQLAGVGERLRFIVPYYAAVAVRQQPSQTLTDIAMLASGIAGYADIVEAPEKMLLALDSEAGRDAIHGLPAAKDACDITPRTIKAQDIQLSVNLLARSEVGQEYPKTQSPSNLDYLLVSPLAWMLRQLGAEPAAWEPEQYSPLVSGSLAHAVFERLFPGGTHRPDWEQLEPQIESALDDAFRTIAPFLNTATWLVERGNLLGTVTRAARHWCDVLNALDANVVQAEIWLKGHYQGIALRGQADALLDVPGSGIIVVDYKNSSGDKFGIRMAKQMDLQTTLYRKMLETDGPASWDEDENARVRKELKHASLGGVAYYTLRDSKTHSDCNPGNHVGGWVDINTDVSEKGMALLDQRFQELRGGRLCVPRASMLKNLDKMKVPPYALELSPLTQAFQMDDSAAKGGRP